MPFVISWPQNTFLAEFEGTITADEIEAVNNAFSGDERMEKIRYSVWDFSLASSIDMPELEIEDAAAFDKGVSLVRPKLKGALIVSNDKVRASIEQYLSVANELNVEWDTRIFESMLSSKTWLEGHS